MIFHFTNPNTEKRLWELAGKMPQSEKKKCDPNKTMQESTFEGIRAEYGFCYLIGIPFNWELKEGGDGGLDFIITNRWCQMKYNNWRPPVGELYFRDSQPWIPRVQISILSVPTKDLVSPEGKALSLGGIEYIGWTGKKRFKEKSRRHVWPGKCRTEVTTMKAADLKPMEDLLRFLFPFSYSSSKELRQTSFL